MTNRDEMITALTNGVCRVKFTKVNGDVRDMECTRNLDMMPESVRPKHASHIPETVIPVYDFNANGWRSFKIENVQSFEVIKNG